MEQFEKQKRIKEFDNLCNMDLSNEDLSSVNVDTLLKCNFDTKTVWPEKEKLPVGFSPEKVIEEGKNPGLGIRELHEKGIDGRGITVAIIDQVLSSKRGEFTVYDEYASKIIDYKEFGNTDDEEISLHGTAVSSLLVGKTCGVAPGSKLVYRATQSGVDSDGNRNFNVEADALLDIIELNKSLLQKNKVRIVSCSIGYMETKSEPGLERWIDAIKKAEDEGIIVSDVGERTGIDYIGGGASGDKENIDNYNLALFLEEKEDEELDKLIFQKDVNGILKRLREKRNDLINISDIDLREKIQERLNQGKGRDYGIVIPSDYRTMASRTGPGEYMYEGKGGMSWSVPYLTGVFALMLQIKPDLKKEQIAEIINKTALPNNKGIKVINPKGIIEAVEKLNRNEKKEKPEVLYVSAQTPNIKELTPMKGNSRDVDEGAVIFSTPDKALASIFLIEGHNDSWTKISYYGDIPCVVIRMDREEFLKRDKGGIMYEVPNNTFDYNPDLGMGEKEWTSRLSVKPAKETPYSSALDTMIKNGVQVYFVDTQKFNAIWEADDAGRSILSGLVSENKKRGVNIVDISVEEKIDFLTNQEIEELLEISQKSRLVIDFDEALGSDKKVLDLFYKHKKDGKILLNKNMKQYVREAKDDKDLEVFIIKLKKLLFSNIKQ